MSVSFSAEDSDGTRAALLCETGQPLFSPSQTLSRCDSPSLFHRERSPSQPSLPDSTCRAAEASFRTKQMDKTRRERARMRSPRVSNRLRKSLSAKRSELRPVSETPQRFQRRLSGYVRYLQRLVRSIHRSD